ncbi:MAG: YkgJ family cysteine cluster protein [Fibrobacteria bacterium]
MPDITILPLTGTLPLTCTRSGTCCHGKSVWLNPWELARLAAAKGITPRAFRDRYCEFGGIRLRFDGPAGWKNLPACSQYVPGSGCSAHAGRPLACRLYPLGRQRQGERFHYIHQGSGFPCLEGCPDVVKLPHMTVAAYLAGQETKPGETAQDEYLELMQRLADGAFGMLLETGLAASGDTRTLTLWRELGSSPPEGLAKHLGPEWLDRLMLPDLDDGFDGPADFCRRHFEMLDGQTQSSFGELGDFDAVREASGLLMGLALHLGRAVGADPVELVGHWIGTAKGFGALE